MQPHQQRVIDEKSELDNKREKLAAFVGTNTWESLSIEERERLNRQLVYMTSYSEVLGERIASF